MRKINNIVFHCTGAPQNQSTEVIKNYWKSKGWKNPGYHYLYSADGTEESLQPIELVSNGVEGHNSDSIHLCYKGGVDKNGNSLDNRTQAQKDAMEERLKALHKRFPYATIKGHRDFSPDKNKNGVIESFEWTKSCPSFDVSSWLKEINFKSEKLNLTGVTTSNLNLREGEGTQFPVITVLPKGTKVQLISKGSRWVYVSYEDTLGWVNSDYLNFI